MHAIDAVGKNANVKTLGGNFLKGREVLHIKIEEEDSDANFWDNISAMFTYDGSQATVITSREVFVLILNKTEPDLYLKYSNVPFL